MLSSVALFLACLQPLVLAQDNDVPTKDLPGMGYLFTAYDTAPSSGCSTDAPVLFKKHLQLSYCYKGSPSLFNGLNYGSASCDGAYDGSFMIEGVSEGVFNVRRYPGPGCIRNGANVPDEKIIATNKCITSSGSFNFAFPLKYENDFGPVFAETYANRSPKNVPVAVCPRPTSTATSVTVTSTSSATGTSTSATGTGTATASTTTASSTATKTGSVVSAAAPVTGSMIGVAAVAIAISSFM